MMNVFTKNAWHFTLLLGLALFTCPALLMAEAYTLQDDDVEVDSKGYITSCSYDYSNTDIIIPSTLDSKTVTGVAAKVFKEKGIVTLTLPSTIENVEEYAFYHNNLTSVIFENNSNLRTIESTAFAYNDDLKSISLPTNANDGFVKYYNYRGEVFNSGDEISDYYRNYSAQIPYILTDADVTIEDGIITACSYDFSNSDIIIPSTLNSQTVIGIKDASGFTGIFSSKKITSVTIPASLKTIGTYAFYSNKLFEVTIDANSKLQMIGDGAFKWNSYLSSITLPTNALSTFICYQDENGINYSQGDQIADFDNVYITIAPYTLTDDDVVVTDGYIQSCSYNFDSKVIVIPALLDGQTIIGIADYSYLSNRVFCDKGIVSVELPNTLEYIGIQSFGSNNIMSLVLPASLKTLKTQAFYSNELTHVSFSAPSNIEVIEANAFYVNLNIEITLPSSHALGTAVVYTDEDGKEYSSGDIVTEVSKKITISVPNGINSAYDSNSIKIIVAPNPTSGNVIITNNQIAGGNIEVYNASGLLVKNIDAQVGKTNASINEFPNGVYIFIYQGRVISKIVKR